MLLISMRNKVLSQTRCDRVVGYSLTAAMTNCIHGLVVVVVVGSGGGGGVLLFLLLLFCFSNSHASSAQTLYVLSVITGTFGVKMIIACRRCFDTQHSAMQFY